MQASLSMLARSCAASGLDIADEDLGPHWGRCIAALISDELPAEAPASRPAERAPPRLGPPGAARPRD